MSPSEQPNQQASQPVYQQNIVIVGKQKSVGLAFILAFFFGPLGLLYSSVVGGIVMFFVGIFVAFITLGFGLIFIWIGCIIWAVVAANMTNSKLSSNVAASMNTGMASPYQQQNNQSIPQQPIVPQPPPAPIVADVINPVQEPKIITPEPVQFKETTQTPNEIITEPKNNLISPPAVKNNYYLIAIAIAGIIIIAGGWYIFKLKSDLKNNTIASSADSAKVANVSPGGDTNAPTQSVSNNINSTINGIYPQSSTRLLTGSDLSPLGRQDLKIMRNEIFARHGYIFKTPEMKQYFSAQSWYRPLYNDVNNQLTDIEKTNVELIKSYEK